MIVLIVYSSVFIEAFQPVRKPRRRRKLRWDHAKIKKSGAGLFDPIIAAHNPDITAQVFEQLGLSPDGFCR